MNKDTDLQKAAQRLLGAIDETYGIRPDHDDDWIYDSLPSSTLAMAYFLVRKSVIKGPMV